MTLRGGGPAGEDAGDPRGSWEMYFCAVLRDSWAHLKT